MSFDCEGTLYGWDLGNDKLWIIDTETGEATEIASLGIDLNYAQDGDFLRESDVLYLTATTSSGTTGLYVVDEDTGECELIDNFEGGAQITGSMFDQCGFCIPHDISIRSIDYPESGPAGPKMDMQITTRNEGNGSDMFDAKMEEKKSHLDQ